LAPLVQCHRLSAGGVEDVFDHLGRAVFVQGLHPEHWLARSVDQRGGMRQAEQFGLVRSSPI